MNLSQAKKRMQTIEKSICELKKNGFSVFVVDSEKLVLESPKRKIINDKKHSKAISKGTSSYGSAVWIEPDLKHDYVIFL